MQRALLLFTAATSCALAVPSEYEHALLASARPCPNSVTKQTEYMPKFQLSYLYWQSKEGGLEYGSKSELPFNLTSATQLIHEKLYVPEFAWRPGLKFDFGYSIPHDGWDMDGRWTFYHGENTNVRRHLNQAVSSPGLGIVPLWHYPFIDISSTSNPLAFQSAAASWNLYFNTFDAELGRAFFPSKTVPLRLHLGAKGSWIRQDYRVYYYNGTSVIGNVQGGATSTFQYLNSKMVFYSSAWGLGPRGGLESKWNLGCGFNLIADGALSILCSYYRLNTRYSEGVANVTAGTSIIDKLFMKEYTRELVPVVEARLGFDWGRCFGQNHPIYLGFTAAYEMQYWWSQNHARRNFPFQAPGNMWDMRGDLQLQGLTATVRLDF